MVIVMYRFLFIAFLSFCFSVPVSAQDLYNGSSSGGGDKALYNSGGSDFLTKSKPTDDVFNGSPQRSRDKYKSDGPSAADLMAQNKKADMDHAAQAAKAIDAKVAADQAKRDAEKEERRAKEAAVANATPEELEDARAIAMGEKPSKKKISSSSVKRSKKSDGTPTKLFNTP